jgi:hypothetical protein
MAFLAISNNSYGQCIETLRSARTVYDEGRLHELPGILESCLKNGFNEEEKTEAYRLLILSYIYQDQPALADQAMLDLLHANPRFKRDPVADPNEFINLHKTFRTNPIFRFGIKGTSTYAMVNITKAYGVHDVSNSDGAYTGNVAIGGMLFVEKDFFRNRITLRAEPNYTAYKMTYTGTAAPSDEDPLEPSIEWVEDIESQAWLGMNVSLRYAILKKKNFGSRFNPHLILGSSVQSLMSSSSTNGTNVKDGQTESGADIDFLDPVNSNREKLNLSVIGGIGFILPIGKQSFVADFTYQYGLVNITDNHYSQELSLRYGRAMSDQTLNAISISIGFMFDQYSPKKLSR